METKRFRETLIFLAIAGVLHCASSKECDYDYKPQYVLGAKPIVSYNDTHKECRKICDAHIDCKSLTFRYQADLPNHTYDKNPDVMYNVDRWGTCYLHPVNSHTAPLIFNTPGNKLYWFSYSEKKNSSCVRAPPVCYYELYYYQKLKAGDSYSQTPYSYWPDITCLEQCGTDPKCKSAGVLHKGHYKCLLYNKTMTVESGFRISRYYVKPEDFSCTHSSETFNYGQYGSNAKFTLDQITHKYNVSLEQCLKDCSVNWNCQFVKYSTGGCIQIKRGTIFRKWCEECNRQIYEKVDKEQDFNP